MENNEQKNEPPHEAPEPLCPVPGTYIEADWSSPIAKHADPEFFLTRLSQPTHNSYVTEEKPARFQRTGDAANLRTFAFRNRFFPNVTDDQWNDWKWQVRNAVVNYQSLTRFVDLAPPEKLCFQAATHKLPMSITPYYMSLVDGADPAQAIRRCVVPTSYEAVVSPGEAVDPLGEEADSVAPGLVHRYPDRVLLLVTGNCSTYCRYCTRHRLVADGHEETRFGKKRLERAIAYIRKHTEIRDVLISGGDPLLLSDEQLDWTLERIRSIEHVEIVRIGTKTPAVLPQRITPALVAMLRKHHPLFLSLHFTHPDELTPEAARACAMLADGGIPLGSQTVLLAGVNDDTAVLKKLFQGLLKIRVRPYYLYQCDPIPGSSHFRTPVARGLEIIQGLRGHTTGYAVPTYVIDAPNGGGKVALYHDAVVGWNDREIVLRNYEGKTFVYPDVGSRPAKDSLS